MKGICVIALVFLATFVMADDAIIDEAAEAYKAGNYALSIELYERFEPEERSAALWYNLGNAYYKSGEFARSILQYERALKMTPNDADLKHNLEVANLLVIDRVEPRPEFFLITWWKSLASRASADLWTRVFLFSLWLGIGCLLVFALSITSLNKPLFFSGSLLILIAAMLIALGITRHNIETNDSEAILMTPSVSVKSAPLNTGTDLFIIHEGLKVRILDDESDWVRIQLADGKEGWIRNEALEMI